MSKQYRIAICISGFLRTWEYTQKSFREILCANNNCIFDIYVHTYNQNYYEFSSKQNNNCVTVDDVKKMLNDLNVKGIVVENRDVSFPYVKKSVDLLMKKYKCSNQKHNNVLVKESSDNNSNIVKLSYRVYDQLRKVKACNDLRIKYQNDTKTVYDIVVKTRFDVVYFTKPSWETILGNRVYIGEGAFLEGTIDDIIAIGKPNIIDLYSSRINEFINGKYLTLCPHRSIEYVLSQYKIHPVKKFLLYKILRSRYLVHNSHPKPHTGTIDKYTETFL